MTIVSAVSSTQHAARHGIDHLLQGAARIRPRPSARPRLQPPGIALRPFQAKMRDLLLQIAVGGLLKTTTRR